MIWSKKLFVIELKYSVIMCIERPELKFKFQKKKKKKNYVNRHTANMLCQINDCISLYNLYIWISFSDVQMETYMYLIQPLSFKLKFCLKLIFV